MADTTRRALRLLTLLQSRPVWRGEELADRLAVTTRTVRRDVERLRELGYPVRAAQGVGGGYQLGAGGRLPPLLLDDDEAVAVVVCLRLAAGGSVAGIGEAALRTLAKLDQVLPGRLREQVGALGEATVALPSRAAPVDADVLVTLAQAVRRCVRVRCEYRARDGRRSSRDFEPYRLVATGRRWYLLAFDLDRQEWRTFRLDRMAEVRATTFTFRPRPAPDAASYVQEAVSHAGYRYVARVRMTADATDLRQRIPDAAGEVRELGDGRCEVVSGADRLESLAWHFGWLAADLGVDLEVVDPPELRDVLRSVGEHLLAGAGGTGAGRRGAVSATGVE